MGKKSGGGKSKGSGAGKKAKSGGGVVFRSGGGGGFVGDAAAPAQKREMRREAREALRTKSRKRHHGGDEAIAETRLRMKFKVLQKQLARLGKSAPAAERSAVLKEVAQLHVEAGRAKQAIEALQEVLQLEPDDPQFQIRSHLLTLLMDEARGDEARQLVEGPLFKTLAASPEDASPISVEVAAARRLAAVCGLYSIVLLDYISVRVLHEDKTPSAAAASELRLGDGLRRAHKINPFVAEFIAFAPAFETYFQPGAELPPESACGPGEGPILDALKYLVGFSQISVWLDTDDEVRRFVRCTVFEDDAADGDDDTPPLAALPTREEKLESPLLSRWKRARSEAMDLWAEEMSVDGGEGDNVEGMEEGGEEESCEGDSIIDDDSEDFAGREERSGFG